jgi:hypothetical protein
MVIVELMKVTIEQILDSSTLFYHPDVAKKFRKKIIEKFKE